MREHCTAVSEVEHNHTDVEAAADINAVAGNAQLKDPAYVIMLYSWSTTAKGFYLKVDSQPA